ncbi:MAG TPA: hypothetical protein VHX62_11625 [Solirubrobacteraceae bacterium]|jgi:hypothetical protein|nr:hypothetical protein [Solirubrobacteraceae bacterium]
MTHIATHDGAVTLRQGRARECALVQWLAELDEAPTPQGEVLIAFVDDQAVAALSLDDGRVVANPFVPTADPVALLTLRAAQQSSARRRAHRRRWRRLLPPLRPRLA